MDLLDHTIRQFIGAPRVTPMVLEFLKGGDHKKAQRALDEADKRQRFLREAPREAQPCD